MNVSGFFDGLLAFIDHTIDERFVKRENRAMLLVADSSDVLLRLFESYDPPVVEKWIDTTAT
jgi:predicted Rossmann-fold nucleotide-binding protein